MATPNSLEVKVIPWIQYTESRVKNQTIVLEEVFLEIKLQSTSSNGDLESA